MNAEKLPFYDCYALPYRGRDVWGESPGWSLLATLLASRSQRRERKSN